MVGVYSGPTIDPHIHLWDLGMDRHPWLRHAGDAIQALGDLDAIRRNYLVDDYLRDAANQNVVASVHIEAAWDRSDDPLAEIEWLETLDKSSGVAIRYIGFADLTAPGVGEALDRLAEVRRCVGVRQMLSWHPTESAKCFAARPGIANETDFRRGVALLARHDQILELMLYPYQAEDVAQLARDFPNQTFIVNHCGSPIDRDRDGMALWRGGVELLGSAPNVQIKISGADRLRSIPDTRKFARGRAALHRMFWRRSIDVRQRFSCRPSMDELRCNLRWLQGGRPRFFRSRAVGAFPRQCAAGVSHRCVLREAA